jgi:PAS domain S-box-containing protein
MPDTSLSGDGDAATPGTETIPALDTLTAAFQHAMIGMAVWTPDGRLLDANRAFSRMFGYEHDAFLAHGFAQFSHPDDPELDPAQWPRLVAGETDIYQREKRYRHKDGSILWGLVTVSALRDEQGRFVGCLAQVEDVSPRRRAEAAARLHEAQIEAVVGQLPVALYTLPPGDGATFQYVSPQFERLTGLGRDELPTSFDALLALVHPDDREAVREADRYATHTGEAAQIEYRIRGGNGEWIWVDNRSVLMRDEQGRPLAWHGALLDISERKRLEASLRDSQERFRRAFEDAAIGMSLGTPDDVCLDVNAAYCRIVGRPREALIGRTFAEITHPDDVAAYTRQHARLHADEINSYEIEKRYPRPDGTVVTGLLTVSAVRDDAGRHLYDIGQLQDITAHKEAEAALRESEALFRSIFEGAGIGMALSGPDGRIRVANPAFERLLGYAPGELADIHVNDITLPDDLPQQTDYLRRAQAGEIDAYQMEKRYLRKDGAVVWGLLHASIVRDEQGAMRAIVGQVQDITARRAAEAALRESEARFRALVQNDPDVIAVVNDAMELIYLSPSAEPVSGIPAEEMLGSIESSLRFVHPEDQERTLALFDAVAGQPRSVTSAEARIKHARQGWRWFQITIMNLLEDPSICGYLFNLRDITDRKHAELASEAALHAQEAAIAELERLNQSKSRFLSTISHEFRTPLTAIIGYSELLISNVANPTIAEDAVIIHREASRLNRLVDDILLVDRVDAGHMSLTMRPVDVNALIRDVVATFRPLTDSHRFPLDLDPSLRAIDGDCDRLSQAITNLISNAVKYSPAGGAVTIATRNDGDDVVISVRDEGIGIAGEDLPRIFDRFERVETGIAGRIAGTGLGLSIVKEIANLHGGRLWADSTLGLGSTFYLAIPARVRREVEESRRRRLGSGVGVITRCARGGRVAGSRSSCHPATL